MSGRLEIADDGTLVVKDGEREVFDPAHRMVGLLPDDFSFTVTVSFPDFTKDYDYYWFWDNDFYLNPIGQRAVAEFNTAATAQTAPKQDWQAETTIADLPDGANILFLFGRLTRTAAPSHSWNGIPLNPRVKTGVWLPWSGSALVEGVQGMSRCFSIYLEDGALKLHRQQSVGEPPGGWGQYFNGPWYVRTDPEDGSGGEHVYGSAPGQIIAQIDSKTSSPIIYTGSPSSNPFAPDFNTSHRISGSNPASLSISTNYASTYQLELVGKLGRRPT